MIENLAQFVSRASYEDLSDKSRERLKIHLLDSLGCAIGAMPAPLMIKLRRHTLKMGQSDQSTLIGGGKSSLDRTAFYNSALIRYLDFNDRAEL